MSGAEVLSLALGAVQGLTFSSVFVLVLFIGFCVVVGFTKLKKTAGGRAEGTLIITDRDFGWVATRLPKLGPDIGLAVLRSEL